MSRDSEDWHKELLSYINRRDYSTCQDRRSVTSELTRIVCSWASGRGLEVQTEVSEKWMGDGDRRAGRVDMVLTSSVSGRKVAIEIDRSNKTKSSRKLQRCQMQGWDALWIRWDNQRERILKDWASKAQC